MEDSEFGPNDLGLLWAALLSRQPGPVRAAYASLELSEQQAVLEHLQRMASEPGWHPEQRLSAEAALQILGARGEEKGG